MVSPFVLTAVPGGGGPGAVLASSLRFRLRAASEATAATFDAVAWLLWPDTVPAGALLDCIPVATPPEVLT